MDRFIRTKRLIGADNLEKLKNARVAIFGIGGVGGYVAEALVRSGIEAFDLIDNDTVSVTNINRQIIATTDTVGEFKTEVMKKRMESINPNVKVTVRNCFFLPENKQEFDFTQYTYVVDAVDTVTAKLTIIEEAKKAGVAVISSMGTGNKLDATAFEVADISKTSVCPLAKVMRKELRQRGIKGVKVVYSKEEAITPTEDSAEQQENSNKRAIPASIAYVPAVAGLILAGEVIQDICGIQPK